MRATLAALTASAERIEHIRAGLAAERQRRKTLIIELAGEGVPRADICQAARVSGKSVCLFLTRARLIGPDEQPEAEPANTTYRGAAN